MAQQNESMLRRHGEFRTAAEYVVQALAEFSEVEKVVLFGSVARPLQKEVPRFREYRRAGIAVYHECKDVDLAVWIRETSRLRDMARAASRALNELFTHEQIGVAHHQIDVFLMEPETDRYLGRLCKFNQCPKHKPECLVPGCGEIAFLQQHEDFTLRPDALAPACSLVLFDRAAEANDSPPHRSR